MPTPLEILLDPISLTILALYAGMMIWEAVAPGRQLPQVRGWKTRGLAVFGVFFYLTSYLPLIWDQYLIGFQLFDLTGLGIAGGAIVGLLLYEFGVYVWHRTIHKFDVLWKVFHQMHHSAERLDTYGTFYFSPMDTIGFAFLGSLCLTLVVGVHPQAVTMIILVTTLFNLFQHANIKTPTWLGYIVQRPESHTVHHAKGVHAHNYSDLPLFDLIFGTFKNPKKYEMETGFYDGASERVVDMLMFKDVTTPESERTEAQLNQA